MNRIINIMNNVFHILIRGIAWNKPIRYFLNLKISSGIKERIRKLYRNIYLKYIEVAVLVEVLLLM